jgi:hypothetical protein
MLMSLSQKLLKLYLSQIRQYTARTRAPQPSTSLLLNAIGVILIALGLLVLLNIWNAPSISGIIVLAAVVLIIAFALRDALARIPEKVHPSKMSMSISKLFLILLAIAGFVELVRRGYLIFTQENGPNSNILIFLLEIGLLTLVVSALRSHRFRWVKPSFKAVLLPTLVIVLVCAFAGIEPLASYKDMTISFVGQGWQFITSHITTEGNVASAVARVEPAVVRVETTDSTGSGMVIDQSGYVLTCNHVVEDALAATIIFMSGAHYEATVVGRDESRDLAIIEITDSGLDLSVVSLGDSAKLDVGEDVVAVGYSLGLEGKVTVSRGIVSAFRNIDNVNYIQTDAAINPGNSGGPLINLKGEVVGVANFKYVGEAVEGMSFAIAIDDAKTFITEVLAREQTQKEAEREEQALLALEREILRLINVEREGRGISRVRWDDQLHSGARMHSQDMQEEGSLYHDTGGMFAECCYGASSVSSIYATAEATVQAWMSSTTGHREILLDPQYGVGGVGVARDDGFWATYRCY